MSVEDMRRAGQSLEYDPNYCEIGDCQISYLKLNWNVDTPTHPLGLISVYLFLHAEPNPSWPIFRCVVVREADDEEAINLLRQITCPVVVALHGHK